ncbi:MAG: hypothetical protein CMJ18_19120 [Phycisphaeraceae bacterium]|nr:hypothetical protein [Phycisphaeraceae bacterium]
MDVSFSGLEPADNGSPVPVVRELTTAARLTVHGTSAANAIALGPMLTASTAVIAVDGAPAIAFGGKTSATLDGGAGADAFDLELAGLPAGLTSIEVSGGAALDRLDVTTPGQNDVIYTPAGPSAATLDVSGDAEVTVDVDSVESLGYDGAGQTDTLDVVLGGADAHLQGDAATQSGGVVSLPSGGAGELAIDYAGVGSLAVTGGDTVQYDATGNVDDVALSGAGVLSVSNLLGVAHVVDLSDSDGLVLNLLGGSDALNIAPSALFPGGVLVLGGTPSIGSDAVTVQPANGAVTIDLATSRVTGVVAGPVDLAGIEHLVVDGNPGAADTFTVNGVGGDSSIHTLALNAGDEDALDLGLAEEASGLALSSTGALRSKIAAGEGATLNIDGLSDPAAALSLMIEGTDGADDVALDGAGVTINGRHTSLVGIGRVMLDTLGGADTVTVSAVGTFPGAVDLDTGDGDDRVEITYASDAPDTALLVDTGDHDAGDAVVVRGTPGDHRFEVANIAAPDDPTVVALLGDAGFDPQDVVQSTFGDATTTTANVETLQVLDGTRLDDDRNTVEQKKFEITDGDENRTMISTRGPGTVDVYLDLIDPAAASAIHSIMTEGTTSAKTRLDVKVRKARGSGVQPTIGSVSGAGLKSLKAKDSDLVEGIDLPDGLGQLDLHDIADGASIAAGGPSGLKSKVKANDIGAGVEIVLGGILQDLKVNAWGAGGSLVAKLVQRISAKAGFLADITATGADAKGIGVGSIKVTGDLTSQITARKIKSIGVKDGDAQLSVTTLARESELGRKKDVIGALSVVGGDLVDSEILMRQGTSLAKLTVKTGRGGGGRVVGLTMTGLLGRTAVDDQAGPVTLNGDAIVLV